MPPNSADAEGNAGTELANGIDHEDSVWVRQQTDKVELHRHLEGSVLPKTMWRLQDKGMVNFGFESFEDLERHIIMTEPLQDWDTFFKRFETFHKVFLEGGPAATREVVKDEVAFAATEEGISHLELRFSPHYMGGGEELLKGRAEYPSSWDDHMQAIIEGCAAAKSSHSIRVGLVAIVSRNYGPKSGLMTAAFARRWRSDVVGFDFAANEDKETTAAFADTAAAAHQMGLPLTVHTGEGYSVDHIQHTLDCYGPAVRRLGHATTLLDDPALVERCCRQGITVESCPTSNFLMGCVPSLEAHPLPRLLAAGVTCTVNTDNPVLFGTTMNDEWRLCLQRMSITRPQLLRMNDNAKAVAFGFGD
ncbi:adenosine deaminase-like [Convolutriloba macropyga]|uniref:adenosine deaminase-like n=1 Tax=Convolutriloba macropyga TaxID=536237 RepID=UPI003F523433